MTDHGGGDIRFELHGITARLVCAAVPRAEVVSGWDMAGRQPGPKKPVPSTGWPKPAQRAAPTGSVYWLDDLDATAELLRRLVQHGLWPENLDQDCNGDLMSRRAEGFNRVTIAA
jgi:CRISPR-associated protein Cmr3